jgi:hypothetical protein
MDAVEDASYLMDNYEAIYIKAGIWIYDSITGTRAGSQYTEEGVIEIFYGDQIRYYQETVPGFKLPHTY